MGEYLKIVKEELDKLEEMRRASMATNIRVGTARKEAGKDQDRADMNKHLAKLTGPGVYSVEVGEDDEGNHGVHVTHKGRKHTFKTFQNHVKVGKDSHKLGNIIDNNKTAEAIHKHIQSGAE